MTDSAVQSLFDRHLKPYLKTNFRAISSIEAEPIGLQCSIPSDSILGIYEHREDSIVVSTAGLGVMSHGRVSFIPYSSMQSASLHGEEKEVWIAERTLDIKLLDGSHQYLQIGGIQDGGSLDVSTFQGFLKRVIWRLRG